MAAGAVLVAASVSVGIGCSLLWRPAKLLLLAKAALAAPPALAAFVLSAAFSVWFIFYSGQRKDAGTKESGSSK